VLGYGVEEGSSNTWRIGPASLRPGAYEARCPRRSATRAADTEVLLTVADGLDGHPATAFGRRAQTASTLSGTNIYWQTQSSPVIGHSPRVAQGAPLTVQIPD
jgi:hypothetical protein